jgi:acetyltransferase-like isoleucine patch superfamily enzyme
MMMLLFKIKRKITSVFINLGKKFFLLEMKSLYPKRFFVSYGIKFSKLFSIDFDTSGSIIEIGRGVQFRNFCQIKSGTNGKLKIGNNVFFNNSCSINCLHQITIGDDCQFGENVKFYDHNHMYSSSSQLISSQGYTVGAIKIGSNCWFGSDVTILKNVEVGDNVIIGANCVIYKSIPAGSIVINQQQLLIKPIQK